MTVNKLYNLKKYVSPEKANYISDIDGEIIIPDDGILNMTFFMTMFGSGMYLGKRTINCHPNPDYKLLGAVKSEFQVYFTPGSVGRPTEP